MMYDEYVKKIQKLSKIKNVIYKFRFLILSIVVVAITVTTVLLSIKGNTSELTLPENVTYGDTYKASCDAVMSDIIGYEYRLDGTDEWKEGLPSKPGEYYVRAISSRSFGSLGHSDEKKIIIAKKDLNLSLESKNINYGEYPKIKTTDLCNTDKINKYVFTLEDTTKVSTMALLNLESVEITNSNGEDVTDCYKPLFNNEEISFNKRNITITPDGIEKVYDGNPIELPKTYTYEPELGYDDKLTITEYQIEDLNGNILESCITPGNYKLKIKSYDITNGNNSALNNYNNNIRTANLIINKKEVLFNTSSIDLTYDGLSHKNDDYNIQDGYNILDNHHSVLSENNSNITHVGKINNVLKIKIYDENNNDVSDYYNIKYNYGSLNINKKDLIITTESNTLTYDSNPHTFNNFTEEGLVEGEDIEAINVPSFINANTYENKFDVLLNNPNDYNVIYNYGNIIINKKEIEIRPISKIYTYGDEIIYSKNQYEVIGSLEENDTFNAINVNVRYEQGGINITPKNVGEYNIIIDSYESQNYSVTHNETSTLTINKFILNVSLKSMASTTYDGEYHPYYSGYNNYNSDQILPYNERIELLVKYDDTDDLPINAKTYNISYYDYQLDGESKDNYIINCNNDITYTINKKNINITPFKFEDKVYDGESYVYPITDNNFIESSSMVKDEAILIGVEITRNGIITSEIKDAGTYTLSVNNIEYKNEALNGNYYIKTNESTFVISKRPITLSPIEIEGRVYNGDEILYPNTMPFVFKNGDMASGEELSLTNVDIINEYNETNAKNVGEYIISINGYIVSNNSNTKLANYDISYVTTSFKITPIKMDVTPLKFKDKVYDGESYIYSDESNNFQEANMMADTESIKIFISIKKDGIYASEIKNAGEYELSVDDIEFNNSLERNYTVTKKTCTFNIYKRDISINIEDGNKVYDGNILNNYPYTFTNIVIGEESYIIPLIEFNGRNYNETVIRYVDIYDVSISGYTENQYTLNYNIDYSNMAVYEVIKCPIEIKPIDKAFTYGEKISYGDNDYEIINGSLKSIDDKTSIKVNIHYEQSNVTVIPKNAGSYDIVIESYESRNYDVTHTETSILTINVLKLKIVLIDMDDCEYDGDTHTYYPNPNNFKQLRDMDNNYVSGLPYNEYICVLVLYNGTYDLPKNAGTYTVSYYDFDLLIGPSKDNYEFISEDISFTIYPRSIALSLDNIPDKTYDGIEYVYPYTKPYDVNNRIVAGEGFTIFDNEAHTGNIEYCINYNSKALNVKDADTYTAYLISVTPIDGTLITNYDIEYGYVTFTISPRNVIFNLQFDDLTKEYDGTPYENYRYLVEPEDEPFALDELITVDIDILGVNHHETIIRNSDTYNIKLTNVQYLNGAKSKNYIVDYSDQKEFIVTPRQLSLTFNYDGILNRKYDGNYLESEIYDHDIVGLLDNYDEISYDVLFNGSTITPKDAGTYNITFDNITINSRVTEYISYKSNYDITTNNITFEITKRNLKYEIISDSDIYSKEYDGKIYNLFSIADGRDGLVPSEGFNTNLDINGKNYHDNVIRNVDIYDLTVNVGSPYSNTNPNNYNIIQTDIKTFEVTPADLLIEFTYTGSMTKKYDGNPIASSVTNYEITGLIDEYDEIGISIKYNGSTVNPKDAGEYVITLEVNNVYGLNDSSRKENYNITYPESLTYTITPREITYHIDNHGVTSIKYDGNVYNGIDIIVDPNCDGFIDESFDTSLLITSTKGYNVIKNADVYTIGISVDSGNSGNYIIDSAEVLEFTVLKRTIKYSLTYNIISKEYDGLIDNDVQVLTITEGFDGYAEGEELNVYPNIKGRTYNDSVLRNADTYDISIKVENSYSAMVDNYDYIATDELVYTISQKDLVVDIDDIVSSNNKYYDGQPIPIEVSNINIEGLVDSDNITYSVTYNDETTNPKDVGTYVIMIGNIKITAKNPGETSRRQNYNITNDDQIDYEILALELVYTITSTNTEFTYDGIDHTNETTYELTSGEVVEGEVINTSLSFTNEYNDTIVRNSGIYNVDLNLVPGNSKTKLTNYDIKIEGIDTIIVNPKSATISITHTGDESKEYDGLVDVPGNTEVAVSGIVSSDNYEIIANYYDNDNKLVINPIDAGLYTYKFSNLIIRAKDTSVTSRKENYILTLDGQFDYEITPREITISPRAISNKKYDGQIVQYNYSPKFIIVDGSMVEGELFDVTAVKITSNGVVVTPKDAGVYKIEILDDNIIEANINTKKSNYDIEILSQQFEIYQLNINFIITSDGETALEYFDKIYDGEVYDKIGYKNTTLDDFVEGESIIPTIYIEGEKTHNNIILNPDIYDISFTDLTYSGGAKEINYNVNYSDTRVFTVRENEVDIFIDPIVKIYNGKDYVYDGKADYRAVRPESKDLLIENGFELFVKYYDSDKNEIDSFKNVGTYYIKLDLEYTRQYNDAIDNGVGEVTDDGLFIIRYKTLDYVEVEITKVEITLFPCANGEDDNKTYIDKEYDRIPYLGYDGNYYISEPKYEGYDIPEGEGFYINTLLNGNVDTSCVDAGIYELSIDSVEPNEGTDSNNYIINRGKYSFTISPRNVTLALNGYKDGALYYENKEYDGIAYDDYDILKDTVTSKYENNEELFEGIEFGFTSSYGDTNNIVDAKKYVLCAETTSAYIKNDVDKISNYNIISCDNHKFTINPREVIIKLIIENNTKVYDGYEYEFDGTYSIESGSFVKNGERLIIGVKSNKDEIKYADEYSLEIDQSKSQLTIDKISNYIIQSDKVEYTITPRSITVKNLGYSFEYDGTKHSYTEYEIIEGSLAPGDLLKIKDKITITFVGDDKENKNTYNPYNGSTLIDKSYDISYVNENLTVTPRSLSLVSKSFNGVYNGRAQNMLEFDSYIGLCDTDRIDVNSSKSSTIKSVSESGKDNVLVFNIINIATNKEINDCYQIDNYTYGTLSLTKRYVTIVGYDDVIKEYSGKQVQINKSVIKYLGLDDIVSSDSPTVEVSDLPTDVSDSYYNISVTIKKNSDNYVFKDNSDGKIRIQITPRELQVTTESHTWAYDGNSHEWRQYDVDSVKGLVNGHSLFVESGVSITDEGSIDNMLSYKVTDKTNNDVTYNYKIVETCGKLSIINTINLKVNDKTYTRTSPNITLSDINIVDSNGTPTDIFTIESIEILNDISSYVSVDEYPIELQYSARNNETGVTTNGTYSTTFNIIPIDINISINTKSVDFTGELYSIGKYDYTITSGELLSGDVLEISSNDKGYTTFKAYMSTFTVRNGYFDYSQSYNVIAKEGRVVVKKAVINIITASETFKYANTAYSNDNYIVEPGLHDNYGITFNVRSKTEITDVGTKPNRIDLDMIDSNGNSRTTINGYELIYSDAFRISSTNGTLTVEKGDITLTTEDMEFEFGNGTHLAIYHINVNGNEYTGTNIVFDVDVKDYYFVTKEKAVAVIEGIYDNEGNDILANFNEIGDKSYSYGNVVIKKYDSISIETESKSIEYYSNIYLDSGDVYVNGNVMTRDDNTYSYNIIINGYIYNITLKNDTYLDTVGTIKNQYYSLRIFDENNYDVTSCFNINSVIGTLEITEISG